MADRASRRAFLLGGAATTLAAAAPPKSPRCSTVMLPPGRSRFVVGMDGGTVTSLRHADDAFPTDYVRDGARLGLVHTRIRRPAGAWRAISTQSGDAADADATLSSAFAIDGDTLRWDIAIANRGASPLEVGDLWIPLPMPTHFAAGQATGEAVLKHSFVSGHGSHIFWMRSNSVGPYLLLLPERDTQLEYWEWRADKRVQRKDRDERPGAWCAFVHGAARVAEQAAAGGRWRLPVSAPTLRPGEIRRYGFRFLWVADYAAARAEIADAGLIDVEVVPGMTVPSDLHADIALRSRDAVEDIVAEFPEATRIERRPDRGDRQIWRVYFARLGENRLTLRQAGGRATYLEFFATEPVETMLAKRAAFIVRRQHRDASKWYDGLFGEWNMASGTLLGPDNYDRITGWRIYEVTCDDPGLSKPAFLATKNAEHPVATEVAALDRYIEKFVWGGLQMTRAERHPYAIYGIPDWKQNRTSADPGPKGRDHIWRPYDYPHILALYHAMHRIARDHPGIPTRLDAREYLVRAAGTAIAMFTVPLAIDGWSADATGFYNECIIPTLVADLRRANMTAQADALEAHWARKVRRFVGGAVDLFGSEYPFDSTGFESTQALARSALDRPAAMGVTRAAANAFAAKQIAANLFCRGWLEPAYYYLGSDYRMHAGDSYTLSYMAQMGGWGVLDHALYDAADPFPLLRLGYAAQLSSWALLNSGPTSANHGYWYPGPEHDGGAGGGFEPAAAGMTWLDQPHHRGSWYYSCEIDLGFCGAVRAAATIVADDSVFGRTCLGGSLAEIGTTLRILPRDGVRRRLHLRLSNFVLDVELQNARFMSGAAIIFDPALKSLRACIEPFATSATTVLVSVKSERHPPRTVSLSIASGGIVMIACE